MSLFDQTDTAYMTFDGACSSGDIEKAISILPLMKDRERNMHSMKTAVYSKHAALLKAMLLQANLLPDQVSGRATFLLPKNKTYYFTSFLNIAIKQNDANTVRLLIQTVCVQKFLTDALAYAASNQKRDIIDILWERADPEKALFILNDKRSVMFNAQGAALLMERLQIFKDRELLEDTLREVQSRKSSPRKM